MRRAAILGLLVAALAGCGADAGGLSWKGTPTVIAPPELPNDRIVTGMLRNDTSDEVRLDVADARLVDASGKTIRGTILFTQSVGHALYSPRRAPKEGDPDFEKRRMGKLAVIGPGGTAPVTVSWRGHAPESLRVGAFALPLR